MAVDVFGFSACDAISFKGICSENRFVRIAIAFDLLPFIDAMCSNLHDETVNLGDWEVEGGGGFSTGL